MIFSRHMLEEDDATVGEPHTGTAPPPIGSGRALRLALGGILTCAIVAGAVTIARMTIG